MEPHELKNVHIHPQGNILNQPSVPLGRVILRSTINYRKQGEWRDYVFVKYPEGGEDGGCIEVLCKLWGFVEVQQRKFALLDCYKRCLKPEVQHPVLRSWVLDRTDQNNVYFYAQPVEDIVATAVVLPDLDRKDHVWEVLCYGQITGGEPLHDPDIQAT